MALDRLPTGVPALDQLLGGLLLGDNVVWVGDRDDVWDAVAEPFLVTSAAQRSTLYVATTAAEARRALPPGVVLLDATTASRLSRPTPLADAIDDHMAQHPGCAIVVPGLGAAARRWGTEQAVAFFARTCPSMLQAGAVTYWWLPPSFGAPALERIRQVTQVMLEVRDARLHVTKAESRAGSLVGSVHDLSLRAGTGGAALTLTANPSAGRLARGLAAVRRDLGLTQAQLAEAAGVTASAISQAESGVRGLSVDTLIALSDRLGVSLDRLVSARPAPGYALARHDRRRPVAGPGTVALADDATVGLRAYLVALEGGETGTPPITHRGIELVAVVRGLVQVEAGDDTPVLRAGDSLLASTASVRAWRNLRPDSAAFYWIVRD